MRSRADMEARSGSGIDLTIDNKTLAPIRTRGADSVTGFPEQNDFGLDYFRQYRY
jgi:hypothetical protein